MSATGDHSLSPAHGHLNLIGFVMMGLFGAYYALTPSACRSRVAMLHFLLTTATVLVLTPGIVLAITDQTSLVAQIGSLMAVLTMATFGFVLLNHGVGAGDDSRVARQSAPAPSVD
ncbi:MAG: hypothetical protein OIF48_20290 [Silicimonas sp.]|nr:hypothetical protein [Silicimonas sp.]